MSTALLNPNEKVLYTLRDLYRSFGYLPYSEAIKRYDPHTLTDGWHTLPDGERFFYISNPALGLWAHKAKFEN